MAKQTFTPATGCENEEVSVASPQHNSTKRKRTRITTITPSGNRVPTAPNSIVLDGDDEEEPTPNDSRDEEEVPILQGWSLQPEFQNSASEVSQSYPNDDINVEQPPQSSLVAGPSGFTQDSDLNQLHYENRHLNTALAAKGREVDELQQILSEKATNEGTNGLRIMELEQMLATKERQFQAAKTRVKELENNGRKHERDLVSRAEAIKKLQKENEKLLKETQKKDKIIWELKGKIPIQNKENTGPKRVVKNIKNDKVPKVEKRGRTKAVTPLAVPVEENLVPETERVNYQQQNKFRHKIVNPSKTQNKWECTCGLSFYNPKALHDHLEYRRPKQPEVSMESYLCPVKTFKEVISSEEMRTVDLKSKQKKGFTCNSCQKIFKTKYGLNGHMRVHNGNKRKAIAEEGEVSSTPGPQIMEIPNKRRKSSRR